MDTRQQEQILTLVNLVKSRLQRDLEWISGLNEKHPELSLKDQLDMLLQVYVHYLRLDAYIESATLRVEKHEYSRGDRT